VTVTEEHKRWATLGMALVGAAIVFGSLLGAAAGGVMTLARVMDEDEELQ
jgi:hypothetical protein